MYKRTLERKLLELKEQFPVLAILGPRQSGKTTLARTLFSDYQYVNLEDFEIQEFAQTDPKGFLERYRKEKGVIFDEIQKAPHLLSYIQIEVDNSPLTGRFILTGSQNILLNSQVSQTLAGRVALTTLLPLSIEEMRSAQILPETSTELLLRGCYPRSYQHSLDPVVFADSYIRTYLERDVRDIKHIISLSDFQKFMRLCAARVGQLLDLTDLANAAGISLSTVKSWLSVLEASYVIFLLHPHFANFNKRVVKMPKLYFYDTSLACNLLRITQTDDVYDHYLRGPLFESMIVSDFIKKQFHQALPSNVYFWRDKTGLEVDMILEKGSHLFPIEIKSGATFQPDMFNTLEKWAEITGTPLENNTLVYGGEEMQVRKNGRIVSWKSL